VVDDFAQVIAAMDLVLDLAENLADFIFDGVRPAGPFPETMEIREKLAVDEFAQIIPGKCLVVVELAVLVLGRGPGFPTVGASRIKEYFFLSSLASMALSCSRPSRYFRNSSQDVCSV
jgi:hypothetical protein